MPLNSLGNKKGFMEAINFLIYGADKKFFPDLVYSDQFRDLRKDDEEYGDDPGVERPSNSRPYTFRMKGKGEGYAYDFEQPNRIQNIRSGFFTTEYKEDTGHYLVDSCVVVNAESPDVREEKQDHWTEMHNIAILTTCLSVVGWAGAGVGLAVGTTALAMTVATVAFLVFPFFATFSLYRASEAQVQIDGWNAHPALSFAHERSEAYKQGIIYVYERNLTFFYPEELAALYKIGLKLEKTTFDQNVGSPLQVKAAIVSQFMERSVLSGEVQEYALLRDESSASSRYQRIRTEIGHIIPGYQEECAKLHDSQKKALAPYEASLKQMEKKINTTYEEIYLQRQQDHKVVYQQWTQAIRTLRTTYGEIVEPIELHYAAQQAALDQWRHDQINLKLQDLSEDLFSHAKSLLDRAYGVLFNIETPEESYKTLTLDADTGGITCPTHIPFSQSPAEVSAGQSRLNQVCAAALKACQGILHPAVGLDE